MLLFLPLEFGNELFIRYYRMLKPITIMKYELTNSFIPLFSTDTILLIQY